VRAKVSKTRRARWVELPEDLFRVVVGRLPTREDRNSEGPLFAIGSTDRLRMAIARACRDAGVPVFSPYDLRHRRISLAHHQGERWAEIGAKVGQRNLSTTADTYTHVLMDYREVDRSNLLGRVRTAHPPVHPREVKNRALQDGSRSGAPILTTRMTMRFPAPPARPLATPWPPTAQKSFSARNRRSATLSA
jgi:hypothetical protein